MPAPTKDFYLDPGTSGFIATPFNLMTTELNALANGSTASSSVGGSSGVFTQSNFTNAMLTEIVFTAGGAFTPSAGGTLNGWWLKSPDGGTTYEKSNVTTALPRPPDFYIPLLPLAYTSSDISFGVIAACPWPTAKVFVYNNSGTTLPATGNVIRAGPVGWGY